MWCFTLIFDLIVKFVNDLNITNMENRKKMLLFFKCAQYS